MQLYKIFLALYFFCSMMVHPMGEVALAEFAKGSALTGLTQWLMYNAVGPDDKSVGYAASRNSLAIFVRAAIDPLFSHVLTDQQLSVTDPRRYLILSMFQAGRLAPLAMDYVAHFANRLTGWWSQRAELPLIASKEDQLKQWVEGQECAGQKGFWEKTLNKVQEFIQKMQNTALSCLINFLIFSTTSHLMKKVISPDKGTAITMSVNFIAQEAGVFGSTYLFEWAKAIIHDLHMIETSPKFTGKSLVKLASEQSQ